MRILAIRPGLASNGAVCYTCLQLCEAMRSAGGDATVYFPTTDLTIHNTFVKRALPAFTRRLYRFNWFSPWLEHRLERIYEEALVDRDIAYLWPEASSDLAQRIHVDGRARIVVENINCHQNTTKRILEEAYLYLDWPSANEISDKGIVRENEILAIADAVFAANPLSAQSLRENGVSEKKILLGSYGWDPERFIDKGTVLSGYPNTVFLSVGFVCVRKGAPLAMRAWEKANINGTLLFVGRLFDNVRVRCANTLNKPNVVHLSYQKDLGAVYRSADVFLFLTLEEGGPMVTFEAMGCGLPLITTQMGAGEVCRDGIEGFIVDPYDEEMIIDRMQLLAKDEELRRSMGNAARKRAMEYTWDKVGARRLSLLEEHFGQ